MNRRRAKNIRRGGQNFIFDLCEKKRKKFPLLKGGGSHMEPVCFVCHSQKQGKTWQRFPVPVQAPEKQKGKKSFKEEPHAGAEWMVRAEETEANGA